VHVTDIADATLAAIHRQATGVYNIGTGIGTSTIGLLRLVLRLAGAVATPIFDTSRGPLRSPTRLVCDTELARGQLGFTPGRSLADGISEEIGWFRSRFRPSTAPARTRRARSARVTLARDAAVRSPALRPV
jgi:nucleoside-diphosphate-sugar epimerase